VNAAINYSHSKQSIVLELEFVNQTGGPLTDFDLMINKNSFGLIPDTPCQKHNISYPGPFETSSVQELPLKVDKKNADTKSPPKSPFEI